MADRRAGLRSPAGRARRRLGRTLLVGLIALVAGVVTGVVPFEPVRVPSDSMAPTLLGGDHVLLDRRDHVPARGDLVVVPDPVDGALLVKRVVAVGGDSVGISDGVLDIDGAPVDEPYADRRHQDGVYFGPTVVPPGGLFLLGDNRDDSVDSRDFGPVQADTVVGTVGIRLLPVPGRI